MWEIPLRKTGGIPLKKENSLQMQNIQGVIFDLDGTLYDLKYMKLRMTIVLWRSVKYLRQLFKARSVARNSVHKNREALLQCVYRELAVRTDSTVDDAENWYQNTFMPGFIKLLKKSASCRKGLPELLAELRQKGIRLGGIRFFSCAGAAERNRCFAGTV
jgi:phosphoglycolate phosphatase-like HAD superfamily hydrolase